VPTATETRLLSFNRWTFRLRPAQADPARLLVLLHGWKGSEDSMWVFTNGLAPEYALLAPRGPFADPERGYTWRERKGTRIGYPSLADLLPAAQALLIFLDAWSASAGIDGRTFDVMGFSLGAVLAYALAATHPERIRSIAALAGFLPPGVEDLLAARPLAGKAVFVTHGTNDDMVPIERARKAVALLESSGAYVTYCESRAGHKVSRECFSAIREFFSAPDAPGGPSPSGEHGNV